MQGVVSQMLGAAPLRGRGEELSLKREGPVAVKGPRGHGFEREPSV